MARKKRKYKTHASALLPKFELAQRFCYFLDLNEASSHNNFNGGGQKKFDQYKRKLFRAAKNGLVKPIKSAISLNQANNQQTKAIENALNFLREVAASERNKEIMAINQYINQIKSNSLIQAIFKQPSIQRDDLTNLIEDLKNFSNNPTKTDTLDFYNKLTILLNEVRVNIENLRARILQLKDKNRRDTSAIRADFYRTRLPSDITTLFKTISGTIQKQAEDSMSTQIIKNIIGFAEKKIANNPAFLDNPYAVLAGVLIDFEDYLQQYFNHHIGQYNKLEELPIDELFLKYQETNTYFLSNLSNNSDELHHMLQTITMQTGLSYRRDQRWYEHNERILQRNKWSAQKKGAGARHLEGTRRLQAIMGKHYKDVINTDVHWNLESLSSSGKLQKRNVHGQINEAAEELTRRAVKIGGRAGTDNIVIEAFKAKIEFNFDENNLKKATQNLELALMEAGETFREDNMADMEEIYQNIDNQIQKVLDDLDAALAYDTIPEDIFLFHESLKLYTTVEQHDKNKFEGRNLKIYNALDRLYTMDKSIATNSKLQLLDKNLLYNVASNLSDQAVGGEIKGEVENYLSIFAGLLMFDDLQQMATNIAQNAVTDLHNKSVGHAYNVHLYALNDIYVPGSLILTTLCNAMEEGYNYITANYGANVEINTDNIDEAIIGYVNNKGNNNYTLELWNEYRNTAIDGTEMQIIFFASFFDFLTDIQKYMTIH